MGRVWSEEGKFRRDLYYRLSTFPIVLPPLAERRDDIAPLAEHFLLSLTPNGTHPRLAQESMRILSRLPWHGNVRELAQVIERALILSDGSSEILPEHLLLAPETRKIRFTEKSAQENFA